MEIFRYKFRAWDSTGRRMVYGLKLHSVQCGLGIATDDVEKTAMQYIGLKDKNGKGVEIYKDDILRGADGAIHRVIWSEADCGFVYKDRDGRELIPFQNGIEKIGNIHENPELMEGEG